LLTAASYGAPPTFVQVFYDTLGRWRVDRPPDVAARKAPTCLDAAMATFVVTYAYRPDPARLDAVRPAHRTFLGELNARGVVRVSGPLPATADAPAGALLVVEADDAQDALHTLDPDPFRDADLIAERSVREWLPVIGGFAS
jgi:uncharacterized protein YciI